MTVSFRCDWCDKVMETLVPNVYPTLKWVVGGEWGCKTSSPTCLSLWVRTQIKRDHR